MRICILTYDAPHRKTLQVVSGLRARGWESVDFLLMPFTLRKPRQVLFDHRPFQFEGPPPQLIAKRYGGSLHPYDQWRTLIDKYDYFIVCGSNLIEADFANIGKVINVHAGLIPNVRGLDSFKWAIHRMKPMGNTIHIIDSQADLGTVLGYVKTDIFEQDEIGGLAARHYESEIFMLVHFDMYLSRTPPALLDLDAPTKRMSVEDEAVMLERFPEYKRLMCASIDQE